MRRSGEQAVNQKKRNSRSETDSTRVEGSVARHSRGLSVHRFCPFVLRAGYFDQIWSMLDAGREFSKDGFWLCALF